MPKIAFFTLSFPEKGTPGIPDSGLECKKGGETREIPNQFLKKPLSVKSGLWTAKKPANFSFIAELRKCALIRFDKDYEAK